MRLKLDENLGRQTVNLFLRQGHDVATVSGERLAGFADRDLMQACRDEKRCLITLDLDFGNPLLFKPSKNHGIAVLRLPARATHQDLLDAVHTLTGGLAQREIEGKLWIVQKGHIREYQEPTTEAEG